MAATLTRIKHALRRNPPREFLDWLAQIDSASAGTQRFDRNNLSELGELRKQLSKKSLFFDGDVRSSLEQHRDLLARFFDFEPSERTEIHDVTMPVVGSSQAPLVFANCNIGILTLQSGNRTMIILKQCWIGELQILKGSSPHLYSLETIESWIGRFDIHAATFREVNISNSGILSVGSPPSYEQNPFYGRVEFNSIFLPSKDGMYRGNKYGSSPWTNMRHHLVSSGNLGAAGVFHTTALSIERRSRRLLDVQRWIGAVYEYAGEYGSSIARPVICLLLCWVLGGLAYFIGDGVALAPGAKLDNWRAVLGTCSAWRAAYLSTSATFNPLSILLGSQAVEPANICWYLLFSLQRMGSLVLLFLTAIAIRRQFRMSA